MNNTTDYLVEEALHSIELNSNSEFKKRLARLALDEMSVKLHGEHAKTVSLDAMYTAAKRNSKINSDEKSSHQLAGLVFKPEIYDISFYSFVQSVMDKICWLSRRAAKARIAQDKKSAEDNGDHGIDGANVISDEIYIDSSSLSTIREDVLEANRVLTSLASRIATKLSINNAETLYVFAPTQLIDEQWVTPIKTNDWDEAMQCMDHIIDVIEEQKTITEEDLITNDIDWSA